MSYPKALQHQPKDFKWKEAASLIIAAKTDDICAEKSFDYRLLMVKRSSGSSFFASAFVFPGGQLEISDFDSKWYDLFANFGVEKEQLDAISTSIVGVRPPIVTSPLILRNLGAANLNYLHPDVGLRISAIRETFEESGVLLLVEPKNKTDHAQPVVGKSLKKWQTLVRENSENFYNLCNEFRMVPDVWSLFEWSDWLTPASVGHRRFDTIFYTCSLQSFPQVTVDNVEITKPLWCSPIEILQDHQKEKVFLAPPQVYELSRFLNFPCLQRLAQFWRCRQTLGIQRWLPVMLTYNDGAFSLLPGDELYPSEPDLISSMPVAEVNEEIDRVNRESKHLNRIELRGIKSRALCNIEIGCGHLPPITYPDQCSDLNSKL